MYNPGVVYTDGTVIKYHSEFRFVLRIKYEAFTISEPVMPDRTFCPETQSNGDLRNPSSKTSDRKEKIFIDDLC